jgi:lipopolysaccharide transport system permease protein
MNGPNISAAASARVGAGAALSPMTLVRHVWSHRDVTAQLANRNVRSAYGGSMLGLLWAGFKPLLMLSVYTLVFGMIFKSRFYRTAEAGSPVDFGLALFTGLSIFTVLSETLSKAPTLITANTNFVKKVVFPLDILVLSDFLATLFNFGVSAAILLVFLLIRYHGLPLAAISVPFIIAPFMLMCLGLAWFIASLGTYIRDLNQLMGVVITVLMFVSPIFFPVDALPEPLRQWAFLNPVAGVVEQARNALFLGQWPRPGILAKAYLIDLLVLWLGWAWFEFTRRGFADVL